MQSKLILGTAQFGVTNYGIKHDGQPSEQEIEKIAQTAWDGGIRVIHTSWQYGLSKSCEAVFSEFEILSKNKNCPMEFFSIRRDGLSVYSIEEMNNLTGYDYDILQIPMNILDNRFLEPIRNIGRYKADGLQEFHARSVFLQGLLLMEELPSWVQGQARAHIKLFHHICRKEQYEYYEAALGWVLGLEEIDWVIVGVNSARQLEQLLKVSPLKWDYDFSVTDQTVLDPRRWPTLENQMKRNMETSTAVEGIRVKL